LEAGLLVKIEEKIKKGELKEKDIPHPFTLGRNVNLWLPSSERNRYGRGYITNKRIISKLKRVKTTRDAHVHGFNFIASIVLLCKSPLKANIAGIKLLDLMNEALEKDASEEDVKETGKALESFDITNQFIDDLRTGIKTINNLSNFRWCAEEEPLKLAERRLKKYALDPFHLIAKETLYDTYAVLAHIGIL
jgi:Leucine-rich repeat (LRR) protein